MKLVIDIDKNLYEKYKDNYYADNYISSSNIERTFNAIAHGKPLTDCTDAISREDAIQALTHFDDSLKRLHELPSVNPTTVTEWADRCRECGKISNYVRKSVLDEIRAEITDAYNSIDDVLIKNGLSIARRIIDKYKAESEDE